MPSPFPGMNPYLELPALWHEFHNRLIVAISDALTPYLQPKYYVAVETRTYLDDDNLELLVGNSRRYRTNNRKNSHSATHGERYPSSSKKNPTAHTS